MNRFEYSESRLLPNETYLRRDFPVRLYDGDIKTKFESGELIMTNHRILWCRSGDEPRGLSCLSLPLARIVFHEEETPGAFSFGRVKKIILHLAEAGTDKTPGPMDNSTADRVKLSFREGLDPSFTTDLTKALAAKEWIKPSSTLIETRSGIVGIERSLREKRRATDDSISMAFQDLKKLMGMAKDMVAVSKAISAKLRDHDITEDETVRFKSYLMSMGIEDPVTRDAYKTSDEYLRRLAVQLSETLQEPVEQVGGTMALADVYCWANRARGMELLSPEDLLNAGRLLEPLGLPIVLRKFDSGVMVLQTRGHDDDAVVEAIAQWLEDRGSATAEQLAQSECISVLLARERLFITEKHGRACRDDSIESLRFYPNLFLRQDA